MGFPTRILEWVAIALSRGSSQSRNQTQVSCIAVSSFTVWAAREAPSYREYILSQWAEAERNRWREQKVQTLSYKKNKSWGWKPGVTSPQERQRPKGAQAAILRVPRQTCVPAWRNHCAGADTVAHGSLRPGLEEPLRRRRHGGPRKPASRPGETTAQAQTRC